MADVQRQRNANRAEPTRPELENTSLHLTWHTGGRGMRSTTARLETGEILTLIARPPATEDIARDVEIMAERRQWDALLVERHQFGSKHWVISYASHVVPPCEAS